MFTDRFGRPRFLRPHRFDGLRSPVGGDRAAGARRRERNRGEPERSRPRLCRSRRPPPWKTADGGGTWAESSLGLETPPVLTALAIDPASPSTVYAGTAGIGIPEQAAPGNIFKSVDGGATWTRLTGFPSLAVADLEVVTLPGRLVFAATSNGIYCSPDGGSNWVFVGAAGSSVTSLAFSPSTPSIAYAGADEGIFKSTTAGDSWTKLTIGPPLVFGSVSSVAVDPSTPNVAYAVGWVGCTPCGVPDQPGSVKTADGGTSWTPFGLDAPTHPTARVFLIGQDSSLYAGTAEGVFRSADRGTTWTPAGEGLANLSVRDLASGGQTLYAGTTNGLFKSVSEGSCGGGSQALCLNSDRFRVEVAWISSRIGQEGTGHAISLTSDTGAFWFFQPGTSSSSSRCSTAGR